MEHWSGERRNTAHPLTAAAEPTLCRWTGRGVQPCNVVKNLGELAQATPASSTAAPPPIGRGPQLLRAMMGGSQSAALTRGNTLCTTHAAMPVSTLAAIRIQGPSPYWPVSP